MRQRHKCPGPGKQGSLVWVLAWSHFSRPRQCGGAHATPTNQASTNRPSSLRPHCSRCAAEPARPAGAPRPKPVVLRKPDVAHSPWQHYTPLGPLRPATIRPPKACWAQALAGLDHRPLRGKTAAGEGKEPAKGKKIYYFTQCKNHLSDLDLPCPAGPPLAVSSTASQTPLDTQPIPQDCRRGSRPVALPLCPSFPGLRFDPTRPAQLVCRGTQLPACQLTSNPSFPPSVARLASSASPACVVAFGPPCNRLPTCL